MARIVIAGYMIRLPFAGNVLAFAQYLLGLIRLGHDVLYVEENGWPQACYDPQHHINTDDPNAGIRAVSEMLRAMGCDCPLVFVDTIKCRSFGMDPSTLAGLIRKADLILNLGGVCWLDEFENARRIALIDMDPMFTQAGAFAKEGLSQYQILFTYGTNIGARDCGIPAPANWQASVPPVVPELWSFAQRDKGPQPDRFTTIANWSAYGSITWQKEHYGQKDEEFLKFVELPRHTRVKLELAVSGMPSAVAERFRNAGWLLAEAHAVSRDFARYRGYIAGSAGEFSVAKHGYVKSRSGWISDRTVCYLAAGKPAVVQDTGVPESVVPRDSWLAFSNLDQAAAALDTVAGAPGHFESRARELAVSTFDYGRVLPYLLERALGVSAK